MTRNYRTLSRVTPRLGALSFFQTWTAYVSHRSWGWNVQTLLSLDTLVLLSEPHPYGTAECYGSLEGNPRPARVGLLVSTTMKQPPPTLPCIAVCLVQHDVFSSYTMKSTKVPALCCCYVRFQFVFPLVTMNESSDESVEIFVVSGSTSQCWLKLQCKSTWLVSLVIFRVDGVCPFTCQNCAFYPLCLPVFIAGSMTIFLK